ncbi:MAG: low molecular weight phosphatase family protein [Beijerinckiaceae bacterium]
MSAVSAEASSIKRPQAVLFACTFNSVRSPMAEALAKHMIGKQVYIQSAGVKAGELDGFAVAAMAELGLDISGHQPRTIADLEDTAFDIIVSLSPEAHHSALEFTRTMAVETIYWPTIDPTAFQGSRETRLQAYRDVRDTLKKRIEELLGPVAFGRDGAGI